MTHAPPGPDEYGAAYADYVGRVPAGAGVLDLLAQQQVSTLARFAAVPAARAGHRYAPDKWSVREVLMHLSDVERIMAYRALRVARGDATPLPGGGFVVNDAYNANPDSMRAALEHLAERAGPRRRVAILGEMAELGETASGYHRDLGERARELGIEVIGVGDAAREYEPAAWAATPSEAVAIACERIGPGDAVLVKASRAVGLEGIADEITNFARAWFPS